MGHTRHRTVWALGTALVAASCTSQPPVQAAADVPNPKQSADCRGRVQSTLGEAIQNTLSVKNDGGWCTTRYSTMTHEGEMPRGVPYILVEPPANGEVEIVVLKEHTRISYRPRPGFQGNDKFTVRNQLMNRDAPYQVRVW